MTAAPAERTGNSMQEKNTFIFDVDGTLLDFFNGAIRRMDRLTEKLAKLHNIDQQTIFDEIATMPGPCHFENPRAMIDRLDCIKGDMASGDAEWFARDHEAMLHEFAVDRDTRTELFEGVADTLKSLKEQGANVVIYTDADRSSFLHRAWLAQIPMEHVDAIFTQPTPDGMGSPVLDLDTPEMIYKRAADARQIDLPPGTHKPHPAGLLAVAEKMGSTPDSSIMVGDTYKDGQAALNAGMDFAWQKQGADVLPRTAEIVPQLEKNYYVGVEPTVNAMARNGVVPAVTLDRGIPQILEAVPVAPAPQAVSAATAGATRAAARQMLKASA